MSDQGPEKKLSSQAMMAIFVVAVALMVLLGFVPGLRGGQLWAFEAVLMIVIVATIGYSVTGKAAGVLISPQKLVSLSRFQVVLWTLLLLSAYVTVVLRRLGQPDPLAVAIDWRLWALMGISTTSLVGTPLLQIPKIGKELKEGAAAEAASAFGQSVEEVEQQARGILYCNPSMDDARFTDMFGGDEVGNTYFVDVSKVQMFVFTIVAAVSYGVSLYHVVNLADPATITAFPTPSAGLVAILAISHSGYLGGKTARQTPVSTSPEAEAPAKR
jgi:hypothetical protein